jgi:hypothetical protein
VYQRCRDDCPADRCREHSWTYHIELPAGPDGKRRQVIRSGYGSAREATAARDEVRRLDRAGKLPASTRLTVGSGCRCGWPAGSSGARSPRTRSTPTGRRSPTTWYRGLGTGSWRIHACLSVALKSAVEDELLADNPARRARLSRRRRAGQGRVVYLDQDAVAALKGS